MHVFLAEYRGSSCICKTGLLPLQGNQISNVYGKSN